VSLCQDERAHPEEAAGRRQTRVECERMCVSGHSLADPAAWARVACGVEQKRAAGSKSTLLIGIAEPVWGAAIDAGPDQLLTAARSPSRHHRIGRFSSCGRQKRPTVAANQCDGRSSTILGFGQVKV